MALARLAAAQKDADLARLAAVSAKLSAAVRARDNLDAELAAEMALATRYLEVPVLRALDAHVLLSQKTRGTLEAEITRIESTREDQRQLCARSFGRAEVLHRLCDNATKNR